MDRITSIPTSTSTVILVGVSGGADRRRLTERDKVKMGECFRLGDIVKAKVVSGVRVAARSWSHPASFLLLPTGPADVIPAITRRRSELLPLHSGKRAGRGIRHVRIRCVSGFTTTHRSEVAGSDRNRRLALLTR
jgi:hypothetical protein